MTVIVSSPSARVSQHRFIKLADHAMSRQEAEARVLDVVQRFDPKVSKSRLKKGDTTINFTNSQGMPIPLKFADLVTETALTGIVPEIDVALGRQTDPFGSLTTTTPLSKSIMLMSNVHTTPPLRGPGWATNDVVEALLEDVTHYRREVARLSSMDAESFSPAFRAYRAHLGSCITAMDAFLNRSAWHALNHSSTPLSPTHHNVLSSKRGSLEGKFDRWIPILSAGQAINKTSQAWMDFDAIRVARNSYVHANDPHFVFALREVPAILNLCRQGVGQLLLDLMRLLGANPLPSVYAVRYAPEATFEEYAPPGSATH